MKKSIFWHRRDLRTEDNAGLFKALQTGNLVQPIFIFDKSILDKLPSNDQRVLFIFKYVKKLKEAYLLCLYILMSRRQVEENAQIQNSQQYVHVPFTLNDQAIHALLCKGHINSELH